MAVTRASKIISFTNATTGGTFSLSTNKIISFKTSGSNTSLTYITQRGKLKTLLVTEAVGDIHTATLSNTLYASQKITLADADSTEIYIMSDRIIYMDAYTSTSGITYDGGNECGVRPNVYEISLPTLANLNTANGNTFTITTQPSSNGIPSKTRYINNLFVAALTEEAVGTLPTLTATYKIKTEVVALTVQGAGYTAATVAFSGGGTGAVLPTATATVLAGAVTQITINTAGSNITADVTVTINGDGAGATCVNKIHHILDTLTTTAGANLNTAPTATFSAGTVTATATIQVSASTQTATGTTITNVGSYLASAFPPTITVAGGTGAKILYDEKKTEFIGLQVEETVATVTSAINAL